MRKSFYCEQCDAEYTGLISVHRVCGKRGKPVTRQKMAEIFSSGKPPGISGANYRRVNKMVENEFRDRGISDYTNVGGSSKITWRDGTSKPKEWEETRPKIREPGVYGGYNWNGFNQPAVQGQWGKPGSAPVMQPGPTQPMQMPGNSVPWSKFVPQIQVK